ncbi:cupin domain-containing protein [Cucurbitaria berberidis CBS 394.84]|uniref:Cupin domain-containing protein n=1 Tax=Cucurbitaria berberidis CBS 394.84 TaxID=1168544 RepID=A0A9P4GEQ3_9PLEO|nr:cupin domain-containing protein [Cucurbitaria berberidis CBS 394.84]KAF1844663.1 cupin domain-containing protein [Cucurbitaria berberidis CBS 394.84]
MAPQRKRENRENNFYNVGVQGRKTGITLADRGIYDEHGLEPISGIFSSPEKSPPKRGGTVTASESMEIQESSIPDLTTSHQILRNSRTLLPPPRSRSPKKTTLGSSPRRQSSMAPRASSLNASSPPRSASHPIARRLDFEHDESSLQETPALSGSGARRGKRTSVYDIPEGSSPTRQTSAVLEENYEEEGEEAEEEEDDMTANDDSVNINAVGEESFVAQVADDATTGAEVDAIEDFLNLGDVEESEIEPEPVKQPAKRGRKRKSDVLGPVQEAETNTPKSRKRDVASAQATDSQKKGKKSAPAPAVQSRRPQRVSDVTEQEPSRLESSIDASVDASEQVEEAPIAPKRRGRPPRIQPDAEKENAASAKTSKNATRKEKTDAVFKKPPKPDAKSKDKEAKSNPEATTKEKTPQAESAETGKLVDVYGNPLTKKDLEQMSTTSAGSRFGRGRHLSVFREMDPEAIARVGRTGRHRVAPMDFWKNDRISYDVDGSMTSIVKNQDPEEPARRHKSSSTKGKKRTLTAVEEEDVELDPWEEEEGTLVGNYRDFDPVTDVTSTNIIEDTIAWAEKGLRPLDVPDGSFRYAKLSSVGAFFNWGLIELRADQMKRTKNSRKMHMVFNVQSGTVEVKVHENEFTVHRYGIWQVPRGNMYSIRNVGSGTARVFFASAREMNVSGEH